MPGLQNVVIHGLRQILAASRVAFSGLNRRAAEEELNLLEVAAGFPAQLGAGASVMPHAA
jgi:UDP-N-acetylenolpyruvoylglucosamine reductase